MAKRTAKGPQFIQYFGPTIDALKDLGGSARPTEVKDIIIEKLQISDDEQNERTASGVARFSNKVHWARFYLVQAGYLDSSVRGVWSLTEKGRQVTTINQKQALDIFQQVRQEMKQEKAAEVSDSHDQSEEENDVPEPEDYRTELLKVLQAISPNGFERLCQRLLRESGFERVTVTGRTGDGVSMALVFYK